MLCLMPNSSHVCYTKNVDVIAHIVMLVPNAYAYAYGYALLWLCYGYAMAMLMASLRLMPMPIAMPNA